MAFGARLYGGYPYRSRILRTLIRERNKGESFGEKVPDAVSNYTLIRDARTIRNAAVRKTRMSKNQASRACVFQLSISEGYK